MSPDKFQPDQDRHFMVVCSLALPMPPATMAHSDFAVEPESWWWNWNLDPLLFLVLGGAAWLYIRGAQTMRRRIGAHSLPAWRIAAAGGGLLALVLALLSPLDPLSDWLASVHMIQHMLLMVVAAPLLAVGAPVMVFIWGLPASCRRKSGPWLRPWLGREPPAWWFRQPIVAWGLFAGTLWIWHIPSLYEAALREPLIHDLEHLTFFAAALLYWRVLISSTMQQLGPGVAVLYIFTTSLHASALGALMAVSPWVWYPEYSGRTIAFGLSPLEDQQLAGVIMWMPACLVYVIAAAGVLASWLWEIEAAPASQRGST